jgi:hypothetical protein
MMEQMCMIGIGIVYPDAFSVVDLIVKQTDFEKAKKVVTEIGEKLDIDSNYAEKFDPKTDFVKELAKAWIDSCVIRVSTDLIEDGDDYSHVADFYIDLDK